MATALSTHAPHPHPSTPTPGPQHPTNPGLQHPTPGGGPLRVLLFNCMRERDPATLLPVLHSSLAGAGSAPHVAIFVAPLSIYGVLHTSATLEQRQQDLADRAAAQDTTWQVELASVWTDACRSQQKSAGAGDGSAAPGGGVGETGSGSRSEVQGLSWLEAEPVVESGSPGPSSPSHQQQQQQQRGCAVAVAASLPAALQWCRDASRAQRQQGRGVSVLVTGSLYLVGDMLRQLDHVPN
ncbi:MAG: hypothetical protein WDW38_007766 [Sanguina aurantia]